MGGNSKVSAADGINGRYSMSVKLTMPYYELKVTGKPFDGEVLRKTWITPMVLGNCPKGRHQDG